MARFYFLACFICTSCLVAGESPQYVLKGKSYILKPAIPKGELSSILWKYNGDKVVDFNGREQQEFNPYEDRVILDWHSAELEIKGLRFEDSGDYDLEVDMNGNLHTAHHKLEVIDKVVKPTVSCEKNKGSSSDGTKVTATLLCSAKPQKPESLMKFEWKSKGMFHSGQKLTITLGEEHDEAEYSCTVSNPLSSETTSFTAKECYKGSSSTALAVGLSIFILLLLVLVIVGVIFCKMRQKACFAPRDPEKQSTTKGTGSGTTEEEERKRLLERNETLPSHQRLVQDKDKVEENQMPPEGLAKKRIDFFNNINDNQSSPLKGRELIKGKTEDNEEKYFDAQASPQEHRGDTEEENDQEQEGSPKDSDEEDSLTYHLASEGKNDPDPADVSRPSSKDEQFGLKAAPEQSGLENNKEKQEGPGSDPLSLRSDSPSPQDPGHDTDIYTSDQDPDPVEKKVAVSESTDTEEAKNQDRISPPKESTEEDLKPGEDPHGDSLVSAGQNEPGSAEGPDKSTEGEESGLKPDPGRPEINSSDHKEPVTLSSSEPASSQDQGHHADINKDQMGEKELTPAAETRPSQGNPSDIKEAQDPAVSGSDEETAQEDGNSLPHEATLTLPSDKTKITSTSQSPSPLGAESPPQGDQNPNPVVKEHDPDADQSKVPGEDFTSSDQTDSGEKNESGSTDDSQSDHDAAPKPAGYVQTEVDRIDKECKGDGQTPIKRDRGSTKSQKTPQSPLTRDAESPPQENLNPVIKNNDPDSNQKTAPKPVSGSVDETAQESGNSLPHEAASTLPSGADSTLRDHDSNPEENKVSHEDRTNITSTDLALSLSAAKSPSRGDQSLNSDIKNSGPDTSQSRVPGEESTSSDQTDSGEKNEPEPEKNTGSKTSEPQSGSVQDNEDGHREAVSGSGLAENQQNGTDSEKEVTSEEEELNTQQAATQTQQANKQQETEDSERSVPFTPTKVNISDTDKKSVNTEEERPEEEKQTLKSPTESETAEPQR